jgi:hypothetical protein
VIALHVLWMAFVILYITWMLYCAIMSLKKAKDENRLTTAMKVFGYPLLFVGYAFDVATNLIGSVILMDLPRELLLTAKLKRIQREEPTGWRNKTAMWICVNLLNAIDPSGHHC